MSVSLYVVFGGGGRLGKPMPLACYPHNFEVHYEFIVKMFEVVPCLC